MHRITIFCLLLTSLLLGQWSAPGPAAVPQPEPQQRPALTRASPSLLPQPWMRSHSPNEPAFVRSGFFGLEANQASRSPSFLELVLLAAALIIVFRFMRRGRGGRPKSGPSEKKGEYDSQPYEDLWDKLRSQKKKGEAAKPNLEPDPEESEFIQGAKATFTRLREAWNDRDLEDIRQFTTPDMLARFQSWAEEEPDREHTELLLLNARLMGVRQEEGREVASVYFDALVHSGSSKRPENLRQVWEFVRDSGHEGSSWLLNSLEDVEQEPLQ